MAASSANGEDWGAFAPPPFKADEALVVLKRALRDCKLSERGQRYELRGKTVAEVASDGKTLQVKLARRLALTPEWETRSIANASQQRDWLSEVKKRLARWESED
jgi:hypothetical protein